MTQLIYDILFIIVLKNISELIFLINDHIIKNKIMLIIRILMILNLYIVTNLIIIFFIYIVM